MVKTDIGKIVTKLKNQSKPNDRYTSFDYCYNYFLTTKVLLGVFGFIPAFDNYFCNSFRIIAEGQCGFGSVNTKSLSFIKSFFESNKTTISRLSTETFTRDFMTGQKQILIIQKRKSLICMDSLWDNKNNDRIKQHICEK